MSLAGRALPPKMRRPASADSAPPPADFGWLKPNDANDDWLPRPRTAPAAARKRRRRRRTPRRARGRRTWPTT